LSLQGSNLFVTKSNGADAYALPNVTPTSGGITVTNFPDPTGVAFNPNSDVFYLSLENQIRVFNTFGAVVGSCQAPTTFDTLTGLTTTDTADQMYAVGSNGLYSVQTSQTGCHISSPTTFSSFTDPQAIAHVPSSDNIWVAFGDGKIAEFSLGPRSPSGVAARTTLELAQDQLLVMNWRSREQTGIIDASDLSDLKFTWLQDGATIFQDDAIVNSNVQPIGGVPRGLEDIMFNFDFNSMTLIDAAGFNTSWDNDFNSLQSGNAEGQTVRLEGGFFPFERAEFTQYSDGVEETTSMFTTFTQSTAIVPEPSTFVIGVIVALVSCAMARRQTPRVRS
jgi:hypothetical protein